MRSQTANIIQKVLPVLLIFCSCRKLEVARQGFIKTTEIVSVSENSAVVNGQIIDKGQNLQYYGHCWNTTGDPTINDKKTSFSVSLDNGIFSSTLDSLTPGTNYFVRAFVVDDKSVIYGNTLSFMTARLAPEVHTLKVSEVTDTSATIYASINVKQGDDIISKGVCWNTNINPDITTNVILTDNNSSEFEITLSNLNTNQKYFVRAFAQTSTNIIYGEELHFKTGIINIEMMYVKGGTFLMGNGEGKADERPVHSVRLTDFMMSKYEVTNLQYCTFLNTLNTDLPGFHNGRIIIELDDPDCQIYYSNSMYHVRAGKESFPAVEIRWQGAVDFCKWAGGRLPTEAEWEYAARGGVNNDLYSYSGSDIIEDVAWYRDDAGSNTHPVGEKQPNSLGISDMTGNVAEFCSDWYNDTYYSVSDSINPRGPVNPDSDSVKVVRGGSWQDGTDTCDNAARYFHYYLEATYYNGFRLVTDIN